MSKCIWVSRRIWFVAVIVTMMVMLGSYLFITNSNPTGLERGKRLFMAGRFDAALPVFSTIANSDVTNAPEALRMMGLCYEHKEQWAKAFGCYIRLVDTHPNSNAAAQRTTIEFLMGRCGTFGSGSEILGFVKKQTRNWPNWDQGHLLIAAYYQSHNDPARAVAMLRNLEDKARRSKWKSFLLPRVLPQLAACYNQYGDSDKAIALWQELNNYHPQEADLNGLSIAGCYWSIGKRDKAIATIQEAIQAATRCGKDPQGIQETLVSYYSQCGQSDKAVALCKRLIHDRPDCPAFHYRSLADCYWSMNKRALAIATAQKGLWLATQCRDQNGAREMQGQIASFYYQSGNNGKAISLWRKLICDNRESQPTTVWYYHAIAGCYWSMNKRSQALSTLEECAESASKANKNTIARDTLALMASYYSQSGDKDKAIALWRKLIGGYQDYPDSVASYYNSIADCYWSQNKRAQAVSTVRNAAREAARSNQRFVLREMLAQTASYYGQNGEDDKAVDLWQKLIRDYPENAVTYKFSLASCYWAMNDSALATATSQQAARLAADRGLKIMARDILNQTASYYSGSGDNNRAISLWQRLAHDYPDNVSSYKSSIANCYWAMNEPVRAIAAAQKAVRLGIQSKQVAAARDALSQIAGYYYATGDYKRAIELWQKLIHDYPQFPEYAISYRSSIANCYWSMNEPSLAVARSQEASELAMHYGMKDRARDLVAQAALYCNQRGDNKEAISLCRQLMHDFPERAASYCSSIASYHWSMNDPFGAIESAKEAAKLASQPGQRDLLPGVQAQIAGYYSQSGDYDKARALWRNMARAYPENAVLYTSSLAGCYWATNEPRQATDATQQAARLASKSGQRSVSRDMLAQLASYHWQSGNYGSAIALWKKLIRDFPENAVPYSSSLASCYWSMNDPARAIEAAADVARLAAIRGQRSVSRDTLAQVAGYYSQSGNNDKAISLWRKLTRDYPENAVAYGSSIASCYWAMNKRPAAIATMQEAAALALRRGQRSVSRDTLAQVAGYYSQSGNNDKAISLWRKLTRDYPENAVAYGSSIASCYWAMNKRPAAIATMQEAAALALRRGQRSVSRDTLAQVAGYYSQSGNNDKAISLWRKLTRDYPENAVAYSSSIASCYWAMNKRPAAIATMQEAAALALRRGQRSVSRDTLAQVAGYYSQSGNNDKAISLWRKLTRDYPENAVAYSSSIASCYWAMNKRPAAIATMQEAAALALRRGQRSVSRDTLAQVAGYYSQSGNNDKAISLWRKLTRDYPENAVAYGSSIASCYWAMNKRPAAIATMQEAAALALRRGQRSVSRDTFAQVAGYYSQSGNNDKAISLWRKLTRDYPENAVAYSSSIASCYWAMNKRLLAVHEYEAALSLARRSNDTEKARQISAWIAGHRTEANSELPKLQDTHH